MNMSKMSRRMQRRRQFETSLAHQQRLGPILLAHASNAGHRALDTRTKCSHPSLLSEHRLSPLIIPQGSRIYGSLLPFFFSAHFPCLCTLGYEVLA